MGGNGQFFDEGCTFTLALWSGFLCVIDAMTHEEHPLRKFLVGADVLHGVLALRLALATCPMKELDNLGLRSFIPLVTRWRGGLTMKYLFQKEAVCVMIGTYLVLFSLLAALFSPYMYSFWFS